jgi:succinate dehydrogenase/fumarate reductase-like Fe-S protein
MQIDPKIVEAANFGVVTDMAFEGERARRVLKAASECVPDKVVDAACAELYARNKFAEPDDMRAALSAALDKWAEEEGE